VNGELIVIHDQDRCFLFSRGKNFLHRL
jgi:hypothetical protein